MKFISGPGWFIVEEYSTSAEAMENTKKQAIVRTKVQETTEHW
jgi:hypothetical protein